MRRSDCLEWRIFFITELFDDGITIAPLSTIHKNKRHPKFFNKIKSRF
jgi:hypothetical protein